MRQRLSSFLSRATRLHNYTYTLSAQLKVWQIILINHKLLYIVCQLLILVFFRFHIALQQIPMSFKTYYNIITDCVLHLALNNIDEILKSNVEKSYFFLMNHPQSVKCQLIKFLLVFSPNCFPPKILSILPAVQYYLIELIIKWLFFCLSCTILLSQLLPF